MAVVVATRNRRTSLLKTLDHLTALPDQPQVIVVDNWSCDGTPELVGKYHPDVRILRQSRNLGAAARNAGVAATKRPFVAFADDDSWWAPGSLGKARELFERHPRLGLIAARIKVEPDGRTDPTCELMSRSPLPSDGDLPGPPVLGFVACGAVVRRSAFECTGGFREEFGIGAEEALLAVDLAAAGYDLAYVEDIVAHHNPIENGDRSDRQSMTLRNELWLSWLRRPLRTAVGRTTWATASAIRSRTARRAWVAAIRGIPWVARERKPVPNEIEEQLRLLEATK